MYQWKNLIICKYAYAEGCSAFNDYKFTGNNNHDEDHLLAIIDKHQSIFPMSCLMIVGDHKYAAEQEQGINKPARARVSLQLSQLVWVRVGGTVGWC